MKVCKMSQGEPKTTNTRKTSVQEFSCKPCHHFSQNDLLTNLLLSKLLSAKLCSIKFHLYKLLFCFFFFLMIKSNATIKDRTRNLEVIYVSCLVLFSIFIFYSVWTSLSLSLSDHLYSDISSWNNIHPRNMRFSVNVNTLWKMTLFILYLQKYLGVMAFDNKMFNSKSQFIFQFGDISFSHFLN